MNRQQLSSRLRSPRSFLLGLLAFLLLLTLSACGGSSSNNSVQIYDNASVLNSSKVQNAASHLPNPITIYTTNTFQGTQADFQRTTIQKLNGNSDMIVMAIDTNSRYLYIARGSRVPLSSTGINQAVSSFSGRFNNGDYTNASIAALDSMQKSISTSSQSKSSTSISPLVPCLVLPLLIVLGLVLFAASRRGRMGGMLAGRGPWGRSRGSQFNEGQPYDPNQGYGPGPYNQGYGPPNRGGMNPWAAGGLGAAAGGLMGYELGRRTGEGESGRGDNGGDFGGGGGNFGGGNDPNGGDFGGGGNFGGGNDPSGGGGNFGGGFGGSNFFGGGGDFGGGDSGGSFGGGGDFGGGGGDSGGGGNF